MTGAGEARLQQISLQDWPSLADDLGYAGLIHGLTMSERYLKKQSGKKIIPFGDRQVTVSQLLKANSRLKRLVAQKPAANELLEQMQRLFTLYRVILSGRQNIHARNILVTAYYQPIFEGRLTSSAEFQYPLYRIPDNLVQRSDGKIGRLENGAFVPYWTRGEIQGQNRLAGQEIAWLKDPVDAFSLHVQGSGLIRLEDGSLRSVRYGRRNGHPYRSIGKYMVDTGRMPLEQAGFDTIRQYLAEHPEEREQILSHNASYIFFRWSNTTEAIGSMGEPVSAGRSVAADPAVYPLGAVGFLSARMPKVQKGRVAGFKDMHRFVLVQDTGSAIKGVNRLDFFWGRGKEAGTAAGRVKQQGALYLFLPAGT